MNPRCDRVVVLSRFRPLLRLLQAFNFEHFHHHNWRSTLRSICCGLYAFLIGLLILAEILLGIWYVVENDYEFGKLVIALPMQTSIAQMEITYLSLLRKNRIIRETIERLQIMIDSRE